MADKIIPILPVPDMKGLNEIIEEQKAYYAGAQGITGKRATMIFVDEIEPLVSEEIMDELTKPDTSKMIFVFGSNEAGVHGAGAAKHAWAAKGAVRGHGWGPMGQSYAIPTKDRHIETLPKAYVRRYVDSFLRYARVHTELTFQVTAIGCGLAGFKHEDIAPMFVDAPDNCYFDTAWKPWLPDAKFWGTF